MNRSKYSTVFQCSSPTTVLQILSEENLQNTNPSTSPFLSFLQSTFAFGCMHLGIIHAEG